MTVINKENLAEFQRWMLEPNPHSDTSAYDVAGGLYFELPLADILKGMPPLSPIAQEVIAIVITHEHGHKDKSADAETLLNLAESQPILLGKTYAIAGNSPNGQMYPLLIAALEKRPFDKNLPVIYALMHFRPVYGFHIGTGDIGKTSAKNTKILNEIFEKSISPNRNDQFSVSAYELINSLDMGKLLNFTGASPEFRARINAAVFNEWGNDKREQIVKINPKLINEQILRDFINTPKPKAKDTTDAKTQAQKNANILPISYTKPRDALIRLVEKQEIHDRNNYGKHKTMTQRFKDLKTRMQKDKTWPADNPGYETLARDVYLKMIQRDIIDGRSADLSADELQKALQADKTGFYVRKIPDEVLKKFNLRLNPKQNAIVSARNSGNAEMVIRLDNLPSRDKRSAIERLERNVVTDAPVRDALDLELAAYDKDYVSVKSAGTDLQNTNTIYTDMNHIQVAYKYIRGYFKDGKPNPEETYLSQSEIERTIYYYLTGATDRKIQVPTYNSLPIFGRGSEKDRRKKMEREISNFNKVLANVRNHTTIELALMWAQYRGAILNSNSLTHAADIRNNAENIANVKHVEFNRTHRTRDTIESEQKKYATKKESLANAKTDFKAQQEKLRDISRHHMGHNQTGKLTPVTDNMSPEDKHKVRAQNRKMLTDRLAARMAEMSANINMDR